MKLLIVYGTTEGQTRKIAAFMADRLQSQEHSVTLADAADLPDDLVVESFEGAIVAASLHMHRYQNAVLHFLKLHRDALSIVPSAFVSVSLAALSGDADDRADLEKCVADFLHETGWEPTVVHHANGALRYTEYDFLRRWMMKFIATRYGGPADTARDYEYTDWDALATFVDGFAEHVASSLGA